MAVQRVGTGNWVVAILAAAAAAFSASAHAEPPKKPLGLDKVIAFTYLTATFNETKTNYNVKQIRSATLVEPVEPTDWRYWSSRGGRRRER